MVSERVCEGSGDRSVGQAIVMQAWRPVVDSTTHIKKKVCEFVCIVCLAFFKTHLFHVCPCVHLFALLCMWGSEDSLWRRGFSPNTVWIHGWNLGCQAWQQAPYLPSISLVLCLPFFVFKHSVKLILHALLNKPVC